MASATAAILPASDLRFVPGSLVQVRRVSGAPSHAVAGSWSIDLAHTVPSARLTLDLVVTPDRFGAVSAGTLTFSYPTTVGPSPVVRQLEIVLDAR